MRWSSIGKRPSDMHGLEMEQSETVSLRPKGRDQQAQVTWPEDRGGVETKKRNRREEEKPDRAEELSQRGE